jgi:hypothetical protein
MPVRFPYIAIASTRGDSSLAPLLPLELRFKDGESVKAHGLLDSGATVNVLPYNLGLRLGAVWDAQTVRVTLAGNLAAQEARALLIHALVADFAPVPAGVRVDARRERAVVAGPSEFLRHL